MPSGLLQATNENLYGTTGSSVFVITTEGQFSTLYNVAGPSGLIQATDGNFYGTAGGGNLCFLAPGIELDCGTIFGITDRGLPTYVHRFCDQAGCPDGANPSGLVQAADGKLYGTTEGSIPFFGPRDGTVFEIAKGELTTLHTFDGDDGSGPPGADTSHQ